MRPRVIATASFVATPRSLRSIAGITVTLGLMLGATPLVAQSFAGARARVDAQPGFFGGAPTECGGLRNGQHGRVIGLGEHGVFTGRRIRWHGGR